MVLDYSDVHSTTDIADEVSTERSRRRKARPRNQSGDSEGMLKSSSASSDMGTATTVVTGHYMESKI